MRLRIASRKSDLARIQSHEVAEALKKAHPHLEIEFHFSESLGDKNLTDPLWKMPGKGVFTADLTNDLIAGRADLIVHSWKDLPVEDKPETEIAATLPRADVRDLLLFKKSSQQKLNDQQPIRLFSSSPRREYNLRPFLRWALPHQPVEISFESVRGNVPTRLRKLSESDVDGMIVAKAAVDRLLGSHAEEFADGRTQVRKSLGECDFMVLPLSMNPAAAAQGALAIEIRRDRQDVRELLKSIHHEQTFQEAIAERQILQKHGGGCHQKIGITVLKRPKGQLTFMRGLTEAGLALDECSWLGSSTDSVEILKSDLLFERKLKATLPHLESYTALCVAHGSAWPESLHFSGAVWTAGLSTWRQLAQRGVWVNGSSEGLGENEDPRLNRLAPSLNWATLSHSQAAAGERGPIIATYELVAKTHVTAPRGESLHWTSGVLFEEALRRWPDLKNRRHSCGPGKTWEIVQRHIPNVEIRWPIKGKA